MLEAYHSQRLVRAFGRESHEQNRFDVASGTVRKIFWKLESTSALVHPLSDVLTASLLLGIVAVMAMRAPGQMAASLTFLILLYRLQPRIRQFDSDRVALNAFSASVEEVRKLLDETDKPYLRSGARVLNSIEKGIVLEKVSLCYDSAKGPALDEVTCSFNNGETPALVDPSAAGKSSLISLVCRFYDSSAGRLLIDGIPLQELDLARWRSQIAVVSQDVYLFNATVSGNYIYGN